MAPTLRLLSAVVCFLVAQEAAAVARPDDADWSLGGIQDITELDLGDLLKMPVVESATRHKQSMDEAPAALEVFEHDEIVNAGITSFADLLRRVPGVFVAATNANRFDVGIRGVQAIANNRVLVLLNGRRLAEIDGEVPTWQAMPVHVGEIERIEVLRGPGTIIYGADAISGVVNIVTRAPLDNTGAHAMFAAGETWLPDVSGDLHGDRIQNLGNGYATYNVSDSQRKIGFGLTAGWTHLPDWMPADSMSIQRDGDFGYHLASTLDWRPSSRTSLALDARAVWGENSRTYDALFNNSLYSYVNEQAMTLALHRDEFFLPNLSLTVNGDFRRLAETTMMLIPGSAISFVGTNSAPDTLVKTSPSNYRGHLVSQLLANLFQGRSTLSLAPEASYQRTLDFYESTMSRTYYAVTAQSETRLGHHPEFLLSLGLRAERADFRVEGANETQKSQYSNMNPRLSLIGRFNENHSLRFIVGSAYRTPSIWELTDLVIGDPVRLNLRRGNMSLQPEELRSAEVGYLGRPTRWLRLDVTGYAQQLRNLVGIPRQKAPFVYENLDSLSTAGAELALKIRPTTAAGAHLAYSWTHPLSDPANQACAFPTHLAQLGGDGRLGEFRFSADFSYASTVCVNRVLMTTPGGPVYSSNTSASQFLLGARVARRLLHGNAELFVHGNNLLAPLRSRADLVQYPSGATDPIGLIVLVGIAVDDSNLGGGL